MRTCTQKLELHDVSSRRLQKGTHESPASGQHVLPSSPLPTSYSDASSASSRADGTSAEHDCMTANELARWLRVDRKTVYAYAARNVIPCRRLGRRLVFLRPAVAAWLGRYSTVDSLAAFASGRR